MINIDSEQGRIGELWWINSDPSTKHRVDLVHAAKRACPTAVVQLRR
jgi:hypothetical protein